MAGTAGASIFSVQQGSCTSKFIFFHLQSLPRFIAFYFRICTRCCVDFFPLLCQAELVSMMLRWLPEDITVHNEDLEGLSWTSLSFLYSLFWGVGWNVEMCVGAYTCRFLICGCISVRPSCPGFECLTQVISIGSYWEDLRNLCLRFCLYYTLYAFGCLWSLSSIDIVYPFLFIMP